MRDPYAGYRPLDFYSDAIGPSLTYAKRAILWIPADERYAGWDGRLGQLTIKLQAAATGWGRMLDIDHYVVSPDTPEPGDGPGGRAFWLYNLDPDTEEPYRTLVGPRVEKCTCRAGKTGNECKHRDAVAKLIAEDIL